MKNFLDWFDASPTPTLLGVIVLTVSLLIAEIASNRGIRKAHQSAQRMIDGLREELGAAELQINWLVEQRDELMQAGMKLQQERDELQQRLERYQAASIASVYKIIRSVQMWKKN